MAKFFSNKEITKILREIAAAYQAKGENRFKIIAYDNAATSIEHATGELKDIWEENKLDAVAGLGKSIQGYLDELFKTGRVKHFEKVKKGLPPAMFKFLDLPGMGPKTAYKLARDLKLKSLDDLQKAANSGKIRNLAGFGEKSEKEILESIVLLKNRPNGRYLLPLAFATCERILTYLRNLKECRRAEPLGSLRRMVATVGDIDIAVSSSYPAKIIDHFKKYKEIQKVLGAGSMAASAVLQNGIQVDLKVLPDDSFGALLQHFTGSKNHNISLREFSLKKGMSLSEHGIKYRKKLYKFNEEHKFYGFLGLPWVEPELREDTGEIEAAIHNNLPKLVDLGDIKGDIHLHSSFPIEPSHDLGKDSFEEIVKKAKSLGYEYIGLSDHSPGVSTHSEKQTLDLIKKRTDKIEQIKNSEENIGILNLLEIDILTNGALSIPEEGLKLLDGAIAGIHSSHNQDKQTITKRVLAAVNSPYVQVISHPTNRLLTQRESSDIDWPTVFEACKKTGTILEINAWPNRLDLPDILVREAIKHGIKMVINTDSHAVSQMDNMRFGVSVARRGWAEKKDIVNTLNWSDFKKLFRTKH